MILSGIKHYIRDRKQASLEDMTLHFGSSADAMRGMLDLWVRKGLVECCQASEACGTRCQGCEASAREIYRWVEPINPRRGIAIKNLS
jgi:putative ferrous iron transport protein C